MINKVLSTIALAVIVIIAIAMFTSCSRGITVQQAASGKARCGTWIR